MTMPSSAVIARARAAGAQMAGRNTPFVFQDWYVGAYADEIGLQPLARTLLGKPVVMFRRSDGAVAALDDRCAHRSLPLSAGRVEGDTIVCRYHGFRYDANGACVEVPSQTKCPANIGVRSYPLVEHGGLVWIWMGDPAAPNYEALNRQEWLASPAWRKTSGYFRLTCNYVSLHENLLDLTHIPFLHANTLGKNASTYAIAPFEVDIRDGYFALHRRVEPTTLPPVWSGPTGITGDHAARIVRSEYLSPGFHKLTGWFYDGAQPAESRPEYHIKTAHLPTPETDSSTHYFIIHGWDFALADDALAASMHEGLFEAFNEDVESLTLLQQVLEARDQEQDFYEQSVSSDRAAVAMRVHLRERALSERGDLNNSITKAAS